jgi:endonuclease/exonuclease/phosphatase family metal-dependent hydrolase
MDDVVMGVAMGVEEFLPSIEARSPRHSRRPPRGFEPGTIVGGVALAKKRVGAVHRAGTRTARKVSDGSRARVKRARASVSRALDSRRSSKAAQRAAHARVPYLALVHSPRRPMTKALMGSCLKVATYNVHRWTGMNGRKSPDPARAGFVISDLDADVIALQEVLRPTGEPCPLAAIADALGMHLTFAVTRQHRRGELGNAILSRFPMTAVSVIDISHSRLERRGALAVQLNGEAGNLGVVATHLSLVDRTRQRQVKSLLQHPQLQSGPAVLLGDMNAWRQCKATQELNDVMERHHNREWPSTFPAAAPVLALDRVYSHRAKVLSVKAHDTPASRRASDHLPIIVHLELPTTSDPAE